MKKIFLTLCAVLLTGSMFAETITREVGVAREVTMKDETNSQLNPIALQSTPELYVEYITGSAVEYAGGSKETEMFEVYTGGKRVYAKEVFYPSVSDQNENRYFCLKLAPMVPGASFTLKSIDLSLAVANAFMYKVVVTNSAGAVLYTTADIKVNNYNNATKYYGNEVIVTEDTVKGINPTASEMIEGWALDPRTTAFGSTPNLGSIIANDTLFVKVLFWDRISKSLTFKHLKVNCEVEPMGQTNAFQLNFKDATDSVVVMLKDEPSYEFSTDGTQMTVYKGTTALGAAHSVSNVASLMYTFVDHQHTLTMVQDTVFPTDETTGTLAYWQCTGTEEDPGCMLYFADSLGTDTIGDATALAAWLAGEGMLPIAYNKEDRYVVVTTNDTMLVANTKYLSEVTNVTDSVNSLLLIYREGTASIHAGDTIAIPEADLKSVEMKKGKDLNKPVVPTSAPSALALYGTGAESDGQAFREVEEGVFVIYTRLTNGTLYFKGDGKTYFVDAEQGLLQGDGEGEATASANEHVSRITVNFNTLAVKVEAVRENVQLKFCADYRDLASLMYQGNGVYKAENVSIVFIDGNNPSTNPPGWLTWVEERYYFIVAIDTIETCWGAINDNTTNPNMDGKPNGNEHYYDINEFSWSQWDHTWKFDDSINGATIDIELRTNDNGEWKHIITVK